MSVKILIVDDSELMRTGIRTKLERVKDFEIIAEAVDGLDAIVKVGENELDVVVMDINMPNLTGIEATDKILNINPDLKIIGLSIHSGRHFVNGMLEVGAKAYLLKDDVPDELIRAIHKVYNGEMYLSSAITEVALNKEKMKKQKENIIILKTKLIGPTLLESYTIRKNIIEKLEKNSFKPFSLILAGSGYGKTIAVGQWLERTDCHCTWLSMDEEHNDFRTFLLYLCAAIEKLFPDTLIATRALIIEDDLPDFNVIYNTIINEIYDINERFILVLDDFQVVHEKDIFHFFNKWLSFPPPKAHLSIISRRDPQLKINSLRNNNQITEIRMNELSFDNDEIADLYRSLLGTELDDQIMELLQDKTGGWIIELIMALKNIEVNNDYDNILKVLEDNFSSDWTYQLAIEVSKQEHEKDKKYMLDIVKLTPKELVVLQCLSDGLTNQEIADKLFNSVNTVKKHITNMFIKMGIHNRLNLVLKGVEMGFLEKKK
jgi:ATP/maltotriose-dependent transcriptional regulator MalT/CheY-like chemotaxis protein